MAIVGTLGPPEAPIHSAIGDMVNTAARFEDMTKAFDCTLVVSEEALRQAGIEPGDSPQHQVRVRGKTERLTVYAVADPRTLKQDSERDRPCYSREPRASRDKRGLSPSF